MWTARKLEAEWTLVLRGSMSTGTKEDESNTGHACAAGFHNVMARSHLERVLKLTNHLFLDFSYIFRTTVNHGYWIGWYRAQLYLAFIFILHPTDFIFVTALFDHFIWNHKILTHRYSKIHTQTTQTNQPSLFCSYHSFFGTHQYEGNYSFKANSHIPFCSPAMSCCQAFRLCFFHLIYTVRCCLIHTCHAILKATSQSHNTVRHGHGMCQLASAVQRRYVGNLPASGSFQLPCGIPWRLLPELQDYQFGYFRLPHWLSRGTRHCRRMTGSQHGMCELALAVWRRHVGDLPAFGSFRLPHGVIRSIPIC
jgi:hypothetical protein